MISLVPSVFSDDKSSSLVKTISKKPSLIEERRGEASMTAKTVSAKSVSTKTPMAKSASAKHIDSDDSSITDEFSQVHSSHSAMNESLPVHIHRTIQESCAV